MNIEVDKALEEMVSIAEQAIAPLLHKRRISSLEKKTMTSITAGNEKLVASKMMLPGSNRRIHSIHSAHQSSEAIRENQAGGSTLETAMQSIPIPNSAPVSGPAPSPDEDDHLIIKKLKTQHLQSSGLLAPTPSAPPLAQVQTVVSAPPT